MSKNEGSGGSGGTTTAMVPDRRKSYDNMSQYLMGKQAVLANLIQKGSGLEPTRMVRMMLGTCSRNPDLLECTPESVLLSLMDAVYYDLEPNPVLGHAYIIPYAKKAQFVPGYKGLIVLAHRSGYIADIEATVVHKNDKFRIQKHKTPQFIHEPVFDGDPGPLLGAYALATLTRSGHQKFLPLTVAEIEKYRARGHGSNRSDSPWKTDYEAMAKKTCIRRICSQLPLDASHRLVTALAQETTFEREGHNYVHPAAQELAEGSPVASLPAARKRTDELADTLQKKRETVRNDKPDKVIDVPEREAGDPGPGDGTF